MSATQHLIVSAIQVVLASDVAKYLSENQRTRLQECVNFLLDGQTDRDFCVFVFQKVLVENSVVVEVSMDITVRQGDSYINDTGRFVIYKLDVSLSSPLNSMQLSKALEFYELYKQVLYVAQIIDLIEPCNELIETPEQIKRSQETARMRLSQHRAKKIVDDAAKFGRLYRMRVGSTYGPEEVKNEEIRILDGEYVVNHGKYEYQFVKTENMYTITRTK